MRKIIFAFLLTGCAHAPMAVPTDFIAMPVQTPDYTIYTWQRISDASAPIRIYIEGDGNAFDAHGQPTSDPTPQGTLVRDLAARDASANVVYMARPCQFFMDDVCTLRDWTSGRFSEQIVNNMTSAVRSVAGNRPIILIGYSGGAMITGLIISKNPDLDVREWITIAGVLNHSEWTEYFGDAPLSYSLNMNILPRVQSRHYVAESDSVVPRALSVRWTDGKNMIIVPGATHNKFSDLNIDKI